MTSNRQVQEQSALSAAGGQAALIAMVALAVLGTGGCSSEPSLAPNEVLVTYAHGERCKWTDWAFRYRRGVSNNRIMGSALIVGPQSFDEVEDHTLRVYSLDGEKLSIPGSAIREMRFSSEPNPDNSSQNQVTFLTVETSSGSHGFMAEELPKFSRSRVLVPVASHYFPDQSDDYMSWGNARMILVGSAEQGCSTDRAISLTRPGHPTKRTPVRIQFPGG